MRSAAGCIGPHGPYGPERPGRSSGRACVGPAGATWNRTQGPVWMKSVREGMPKPRMTSAWSPAGRGGIRTVRVRYAGRSQVQTALSDKAKRRSKRVRSSRRAWSGGPYVDPAIGQEGGLQVLVIAAGGDHEGGERDGERVPVRGVRGPYAQLAYLLGALQGRQGRREARLGGKGERVRQARQEEEGAGHRPPIHRPGPSVHPGRSR